MNLVTVISMIPSAETGSALQPTSDCLALLCSQRVTKMKRWIEGGRKKKQEQRAAKIWNKKDERMKR